MPSEVRRDAELHRSDEVRRIGRDPEDVACAPAAGAIELPDARSTRRDECVLGGDEEGVQQDEPREGEELKRESHASAPLSGARVLGGTSSSKRGAC